MSIDVKVLKSSCCTTGNAIKEELNTASANVEVDIRTEILSDLQETMKYGAINFPSIVIDGEVYNYDNIDGLEGMEQLLMKHANQ